MTVTRKVSVKSQYIRKAVPGEGPGDKLEVHHGEWHEVVGFSESPEGLITFRLAGGHTRRIQTDRLTTVLRESVD